MSRRATTLVELMIVVAMVGILTGLLHANARRARLGGMAELQRERARIWAGYLGDSGARGVPPDPAVVQRLTAFLPDATSSTEVRGGVQTLTVRWTSPLGRAESLSLTAFEAGRGAP